METTLFLKLLRHNVYYVKTDYVNYYITIPKNTGHVVKMVIDIKSNMDKYDVLKNDKIWVEENVKAVFKDIDDYDITLILPIFNDEIVNYLNEGNVDNYGKVDAVCGYLINSAYKVLSSNNLQIDNEITVINSDKYQNFLNWFINRYSSRVKGISLLELIRQDSATKVENYQTISTPNMSFVVGTNEPKEIPVEEETNLAFKNDTNIIDMGEDKQNKGFASYSLLAIFTILVSLVILYVVFK